MKRLFYQKSTPTQPAGYTLIEVLVVVLIVGILSAIISPSYVAWSNNQKVGAANSQIIGALRKAQAQARKTKTSVEVRFDNAGGRPPRYGIARAVEAAAGGVARQPDDTKILWQPLTKDGKQGISLVTDASPTAGGVADGLTAGRVTQSGIVFDPYGAVTVTGNPATFSDPTRGVYRIQVYIGNIDAQQHKRCVIVQTLLGSLREEKGDKCRL